MPQEEFVAFVEIRFSSIDVPVEDEKAFTIGVVMLDRDDEIRLGAIHAR